MIFYMQKFKNKKTIILVVILLFLALCLRTCYYGSPFRSCIYTEKEIPLSTKIKKSKILFARPAVIVSNGDDESFTCLSEMGLVSNQIVEQRYAYIYKKGQQRTITPADNIILEPIRLISVTKHGITTIDSGSGPILYLILKDPSGAFYQIATVGLGMNKGDEFLKAVLGSEEVLLNPDTIFIE